MRAKLHSRISQYLIAATQHMFKAGQQNQANAIPHGVCKVKSSQKSFNRSRDRNSADTAATEFVTLAINIIVKSIIILGENKLNCQAH